MLAASTVTRLFLRRLLEVFKLHLRPNPPLLLPNSFLQLLSKLLLQTRQLRLMILLRLLQQLRERALLRLLLANRLPQLFCFTLHLVLIRTLLDIRVIALLVLSRFVVHLL